MNNVSAFGWALLAAASWGVAPALEKIGLRGSADPVFGVFIRSIGVCLGALTLLFIPGFTSRCANFTPRNWGFLLLGGFMASIIGQLCFYRALKSGSVSQVTSIGASYPVLAFLIGVFFLHETLTLAKAAGILLVISGVYLLR